MRHQTLIQKKHMEGTQSRFKVSYLLNSVNLKRKMVKTRMVRIKAPLTLLPQGEDEPLTIGEKGETTTFFLELSLDGEAKYCLVELLRAIKVAYVQTNMACLDCLNG